MENLIKINAGSKMELISIDFMNSRRNLHHASFISGRAPWDYWHHIHEANQG